MSKGNKVSENGDFLADCPTNVILLTDLKGLQWKKFNCPCENIKSVTDDPILNVYAKALADDVLCIWQRTTIAGSTGSESTRLLGSPKELAIFWTGDEPEICNNPSAMLTEVEYGSYDDGISPENLELFFKSIHSIIEKNLCGKGFVRMGKWFATPLNLDTNNNHTIPNSSLAFSFTMFVHGESMVVAAVNVEDKSCIRRLTSRDLQTSSLPMSDTHVLLAPYGLNAKLTGQSLDESDPRSAKIIDEWQKFFPSRFSATREPLISVVEVLLADVKMLYPAQLVMVEEAKKGSKDKKSSDSKEARAGFIHCVKRDSEVKESSEGTPQWPCKERCVYKSCGCSSMNTSNKSKPSPNNRNPFSNICKTPKSTPLTPAICKYISNLPQVNSFHQRCRLKSKLPPGGRTTPPSLITGRNTPTIATMTTKPLFDPPSTNLTTAPTISTEVVTTLSAAGSEDVKPDIISPPRAKIPLPKPNDETPLTNSAEKRRQQFSVYKLPRKNQIVPPFASLLPRDPLEPRQHEEQKQENAVVPSEVQSTSSPLDLKTSISSIEEIDIKMEEVDEELEKSVKMEIVETPSVKSENDITEVFATTAPASTATKNTKKLKRTNSVQAFSPKAVATLSPLEEETFSPSSRRASTRSSTKRRESIASPTDGVRSKKPKTSSKSQQGGIKTPNTPKEFGFPKSTPRASPSTPLYSPSVVKTRNLMNTKDLMPISDDLDHLFEDEDDEEKKLSILMPTTSSEALSTDSGVIMTSSGMSTTAGSITQQDLVQMFPTPPSQEPHNQSLSPTMPVEAPCMTVVSSDKQHLKRVTEHDQLEIQLEPRQPNSANAKFPTFNIPRIQREPVSDLYLPVRLPSAYLKPLPVHNIKYTASWEVSQTPPLLSRRPSNNTAGSTTSLSNQKKPTTLHLSNSVKSENLSEHKFQDLPPDISIKTPSPPSKQDYQSLVVNLTLTDSLVNWNLTGLCEITTVQRKTHTVFKTYQNLLWRSFNRHDSNDLFAKDTPLQCCRSSSHPVASTNKTSAEHKPFDFPPELITLLLCKLSASFTMSHLASTISQYYSHGPHQKRQSNRYSLLKNRLLKHLVALLEESLKKPLQDNGKQTPSWGETAAPKYEGLVPFKKLCKVLHQNCVQSATGVAPLLLNYEHDSLSVSPESLQHWQSMHLEPFGGERNIAYIVALPESDFIINSAKTFFKQLSTVYESLNLGTHNAIVKDLRDGCLRIKEKDQKKVSSSVVSDWFDAPDQESTTGLKSKMKFIAQFCKHQLGPYLASLTLDSSLYVNKSDTSSFPSKPSSSDTESKDTPTLVVYMIDPFHDHTSADVSEPLCSYVGFLRSFYEMSSQFSPALKNNICFQIIPLEQVLQLNLEGRSQQTHGNQCGELKRLAFNMYAQCRTNPLIDTSKRNDKCMTGFGVLNAREVLIRRRQVENNLPMPIYRPPYVLASPTKPIKYTELMSGDVRENTLYCCYALSADSHWLVVVCTDAVGELSKTTFIKIAYSTRKHDSLTWSVALRKLWEFVVSVIACSVDAWRIVLTKIGEVGDSELKELNQLIVKESANIVPSLAGARPMSSLSCNVCVKCAIDERKCGKCLVKSVSFCTLVTDQDIQLIPLRNIRNMRAVHSRVYVTTTSKERLPKPKHNWNPSDLDADESNLLSNILEDDSKEMNYMPLLSPNEASLFDASPQSDFKIPSPTSPQNHNMPSSPFQPIENKLTKQLSSSQSDVLGQLATGYLLSGAPLNHLHETGPSLLRSDLHIHEVTTICTRHKLDAAEDTLEVLRFILERFDTLSWLNVDPSTGKRLSSLPVHASSAVTCVNILAQFTGR